MRIRRILVAIGDLKHVPENELSKAAALAKASGASVELFHAIDEPDPAGGLRKTGNGGSATTLRASIADKRQCRLKEFARAEALQDVDTTCVAVWDCPPYQAIVRRALAVNADVVIAAARGHRFGARLLLRNTDWELIRHCPVALLLVKSRRKYQKPVVVVAVDPFHTYEKPTRLNSRLVSAGARVANSLHGQLHIFHAYMPLITVAPLPPAPPVMLPAEAQEAHRQLIVSALGELAESARVPLARRHICMGDVTGQLTSLTRHLRASLVVMGAVSRSPLARLFIGNTAERVLDQLGCDVLVVKPQRFKSRVTRQRAFATANPRMPVRATRSRRSGRRESTVTAMSVALPPML